MLKEQTDLLSLPRRWMISGIQNVTLYYKIDVVSQLFRWLYKWSLVQGLYKTLDPLFVFPIEYEISTPENRLFVMSVLEHINNAHDTIKQWYYNTNFKNKKVLDYLIYNN